MATNDIFLSASDARQNPIREHVIHDEGRAIESAILDAIALGQYGVTVSDGTPMTQSTSVSSPVIGISSDTGIFYVPNHGFSTGDTVQVTSTGTLPSPLVANAKYYIIYIDSNNVKLAATLQNAMAGRPIAIAVSQAVNGVTLTDQGSGYTSAPIVTFNGGGATTPAAALAYLANYGGVSSIAVISNGQGYTDIPTVSIVAQGSGASAGTITMGLVAATVSSGGSNYRLNDTLTVSSGTGTAATLSVIQVDDTGAVQAVSVSSAGSYSVLPTLSAASTTVTPGGGSGCTLNLNMGVAGIAVSTGGAGYAAQPIVNVTGGSGSGATATSIVVAGSVSQVNVVNPGSGYTSIPTASFTSGENASAIAVLQPASIGNITVTYNGGNTYTSNPSIIISAAGSGAAAGQVYMSVTAVSLDASGVGYTVGDTLLIAGGAGSTNASIQVTGVGPQGQITSFLLITGGLYRQLPPLVNNSVIGGTGTAATFNLIMSVNSIDVENPGSGYASPPTVIINDSTGYGASAITTIAAGQVTSIKVVAPGTGYTNIPTVTITSGENASATAYLVPTGVASFNMGNTGSGYTAATVAITGTGNGATATANIEGGQIVGIVIDTPGGGYTSPPTVTITGDGMGATAAAVLIPTALDHIVIDDEGDGYTGVPTVTVSGAATATASLEPTGVSRIDITNGGDGYTSVPIVNVIPSEDQQPGITIVAPATSTSIGYSVGSISITSGGAGYQSAPTVSISAPQDITGNLATATATIGVGQGSISISSYPASLDYYAVWKNLAVSDQSIVRPYGDRMDTVINYFTNYGYTITRQTNPATGNTLQWSVQW